MIARLRTASLFLIPAGLLILSFLFPKAAMAGAMGGARVVWQSALPALFPALVLCRFLSALSRKGDKSAPFLPLLLALLCGSPVGAACAADLVGRGVISRREAERDLFSVGLCGPSFLIGVCGVFLMGDSRWGAFLYVWQGIWAGVSFFLLRRGQKKNEDGRIQQDDEKANVSSLFALSLSQSVLAFGEIAASIILFSFSASLLFSLFPLSGAGRGAVSLFWELVSGVHSLTSLPPSKAWILCAMGCGWGSWSVHLQTASQVKKASLSMRWYFSGKAAMTLWMALGAKISERLL